MRENLLPCPPEQDAVGTAPSQTLATSIDAICTAVRTSTTLVTISAFHRRSSKPDGRALDFSSDEASSAAESDLMAMSKEARTTVMTCTSKHQGAHSCKVLFVILSAGSALCEAGLGKEKAVSVSVELHTAECRTIVLKYMHVRKVLGYHVVHKAAGLSTAKQRKGQPVLSCILSWWSPQNLSRACINAKFQAHPSKQHSEAGPCTLHHMLMPLFGVFVDNSKSSHTNLITSRLSSWGSERRRACTPCMPR